MLFKMSGRQATGLNGATAVAAEEKRQQAEMDQWHLEQQQRQASQKQAEENAARLDAEERHFMDQMARRRALRQSICGASTRYY